MIRAAADGFRCLQAKFDLIFLLSVCSAYRLDLRTCGFGECSVLDLNFGAVLVAAVLVRSRCCSSGGLNLLDCSVSLALVRGCAMVLVWRGENLPGFRMLIC